MSENSRSRVTITLGHSGQVVKRAGPAMESLFGDSQSTVGRKRSVKDRLGGFVDSTEPYDNKRIRTDGSGFSRAATSGVDDMGLNRNDLRFKIMRKNTLKKSQSNAQQSDLDLRDVLSRPAQSSTASISVRQPMPERNDARQRVLELRDGRRHMSEMSDSRHHMAETRDSRQHVVEVKDVRPHMQEPNSMGILGRMPPTTFPGSLTNIGTLRGRFSPWTLESVRRRSPDAAIRRRSPDVALRRRSPDVVLRQRSPGVAMRRRSPDLVRRRSPDMGLRQRSPDLGLRRRSPDMGLRRRSPDMDLRRRSPDMGLRRRSPDVVLNTPTGYSPPRREGELQRRPSVRSYDDRRAGSYMNKNVHDFSRPIPSGSYGTAAALPAVPARPMVPLHAPPILPSNLVQRSAYPIDDPPTVDSFLRSLGLEKYAINFKAEEVDMYTLKQMGDSDLKDLGIPMGPRKKLLLALQARAKRQV